MAYPSSYDSLPADKQDDTNMVTGADGGTTTNVGDHAAHHNALASAINAMQAELGLNPSGSEATLADRLAALVIPDGVSILRGAGTPGGGVGVDGDYYLDEAGGAYYFEGFEGGVLPSGWTAVNCTLGVSNAQAADGSYAMTLTATATGTMYAHRLVPVTALEDFLTVASFRAAAATPRTTTIQIDYLNSGLGYISGDYDGDYRNNDNISWTTDRNLGTIPSGAVWAKLQFIVQAAAAGEVHYLDSIAMRKDQKLRRFNEPLLYGPKTGGAWPNPIVLRGADGATGDTGSTGSTGPSGVVAQSTPPADTSVLWLDTSDDGEGILPPGGTINQILVKASGIDSDAEWRTDAVARIGSPNAGDYITGRYYDTSLHSTAHGTIAGASNRIDLSPFAPSEDFPIDRIGVNCTTLASSSNVRVLIYEAGANGMPDAKVYESANMATTSTGGKEVTLSFTFEAGKIYWVGVHYSAAPTISGIPIASLPNLGLSALNATNFVTVIRRTVTFGSAPSTFAFTTADLTANVVAPSVRFRVA